MCWFIVSLERKYSLRTFGRWFEAANRRSPGKSLPHPTVRQEPGPAGNRYLEAVLQRLDEDAPDRSRRDFAVICQLLRGGLDPETIWQLVQHHSKFADRGREYFDITIQNAVRNVGC